MYLCVTILERYLLHYSWNPCHAVISIITTHTRNGALRDVVLRLNYGVLVNCTVSCYMQICNLMYAIKEKKGRSRSEFYELHKCLIALWPYHTKFRPHWRLKWEVWLYCQLCPYIQLSLRHFSYNWVTQFL